MEINPLPLVPRLLPWEATLNSRELGGYPLQNGRQTRWKALVRSENLNLLTPAGRQALIDYGIRTVIDLRYPRELDRFPNPFSTRASSGADWPDYVHIPLDQDQDLEWHAGMDAATAMGDLYCRLLEINRGHIARVLTAAARAQPGGVLFHCHHGKDRTGLNAAMFLGALGAPVEVIAADYAFTTPKLEERTRLILAEVPAAQRDILGVVFTSLPETMVRTLAYLDRTYGGVEGYLQTTPLQPADLAALRERMIDGIG